MGKLAQQTKDELAAIFVAQADAAVQERGPAVLNPKQGNKNFRSIVVVNKEGITTNIVGHDALLQGLLKKESIERAVVHSDRPRMIRCQYCKKIRKVPPQGQVPAYCSADCKYRFNNKKCVSRSRTWKKRNKKKVRAIEERHAAKRKTQRRAKRPKTILCKDCGGATPLKSLGGKRTRCPECVQKRERARLRKYKEKESEARRAQRPKTIRCKDCGARRRVKPSGGLPVRCRACVKKIYQERPHH